ncbi:hypothetical protein GCM10007298_36510 [Williamsia phyllosphaerae]|uniref:Pyrrolo-quinoline quinone repeat domain-containing protein n=1 Tax=Williamsia phyllosphaerae TaxID=885042 RepID=A0ABQ1V4S8_9NOCA|nr:hypothetical protein GCM10007298_36510 [Williamsia phyllosphaerae]
MQEKSTWALIVAAVAAVLTVTAAVVVVMDRSSPTSSSVRAGAGTHTDAPGVAWSLDAATYLGRSFGEFSDPRGGASYRSGNPGLLLAGDTLMTIAGSPTDQYVLGDAVMLGIDPANGSVRWKAPAADIEECSPTPLGGKLYCYAIGGGTGSTIVTYEIDSGLTARRPIAENVFGLTTTSETLYVAEGSLDENDVRVHSGSYSDVSSNWTHGFDIGGDYEGIYETDNVLTVIDGVGLIRTGSEMAQFAAGSGAELWRTSDYRVQDARLAPGGVLVQSNTDGSTGGKVSEQVLRGPDGKILASTRSTAVQRVSNQNDEDDADAPILLGDAAYDRSTGKRLWAGKDLVAGQDIGAVTAIAADTVYLRDSDMSETGIDLRTGKRRWRNDKTEHFQPLASAGTVVLGNDGSALTAFDIRSGRTRWTAPFSALDPDPDTFSSGGAAEAYGDGWIFSSDRRMIGLAPP